MTTFSVFLTIVALVGVALLILLFERKRARRIERDLSGMADERAKRRSRPPQE